jgi:hypothetical protein
MHVHDGYGFRRKSLHSACHHVRDARDVLSGQFRLIAQLQEYARLSGGLRLKEHGIFGESNVNPGLLNLSD